MERIIDVWNATEVEQKQFVFGGILLLANKLQVFGNRIMKGITMKQWFLLMMIAKMEIDHPSVKEIAEFTGNTRQNVKKMLELLEKEDYVALTPSIQDKRAWEVNLTKKTEAYFHENSELAKEVIESLFEAVTLEETKTMIQVIFKLLEAVK